MAKFIREKAKFQKMIFGSSYAVYAKKKKKAKSVFLIVCKSDPECEYELTCAAAISQEGEFIRCVGQCCKDGLGVWPKREGETLETLNG